MHFIEISYYYNWIKWKYLTKYPTAIAIFYRETNWMIVAVFSVSAFVRSSFWEKENIPSRQIQTHLDPSRARTASSASRLSSNSTKANPGGFRATQTFRRLPYFENADSISWREVWLARLPMYTLQVRSQSRLDICYAKGRSSNTEHQKTKHNCYCDLTFGISLKIFKGIIIIIIIMVFIIIFMIIIMKTKQESVFAFN